MSSKNWQTESMFNLNEKDRLEVKHTIRHGDSARLVNRSHILNLRDKGYTSNEVADVLDYTARTVINIVNNYIEGGLQQALTDDPRPGRPPEIDARIESHVVAVVCSEPPEGFDRWTLELLKNRVEHDGIVDSISKESIRIILKEHDLKPWQQKMWCIPNLTEEYKERMEAILDAYELEYNAHQPVICIDEKPVVLHADKSPSMEMEPGKIKKVDDEYIRKGTANVFMAVEPKSGFYFGRVTPTRSGDEFAKFLFTVYKRYKHCEKVTLVMDNLSTHSEKALIRFYGEEKGRRIWQKFDIRFTPKHGSWLNQAEIAIGMYARQYLGNARIPDINTLRKKTNAWFKYMQRKAVIIKWTFNARDAREKFHY